MGLAGIVAILGLGKKQAAENAAFKAEECQEDYDPTTENDAA